MRPGPRCSWVAGSGRRCLRSSARKRRSRFESVRLVAGEGAAELPDAWEQRHLVDSSLELLRVDEVEPIGFVDGCFEAVGFQGCCEVHQRKQRATKGDSSFGCGWRHRVAAVHFDALQANATIVRDRHVDGIEAAVADAPEIRGAFVRQGGAVAACEDGGHEEAVAVKRAAADAVDTGPFGNELPTPDAMTDRLRGEAERKQLRARNHVVLPAHECPDSLMVDRCPYRGQK